MSRISRFKSETFFASYFLKTCANFQGAKKWPDKGKKAAFGWLDYF
jgi:hypothetical protein